MAEGIIMAGGKGRSKARLASSIDIAIGARVRAVRLDCALSQQALADRLGVTFQQLQKYERGTNRIAVARLIDIASALDQPLSWFLRDLVPCKFK